MTGQRRALRHNGGITCNHMEYIENCICMYANLYLLWPGGCAFFAQCLRAIITGSNYALLRLVTQADSL